MSSDVLTEAQPESLSELFSRDPLSYSNQDLDQIIKILREARLLHAQADAQARVATKKIAKPKLTPDQIKSLNLDNLLGDL